MNLGIQTVTTNLNMGFENIIILIVILGGLIFYAKDVKLGFIMGFLMFAAVFMWFYAAGLFYTLPLMLSLGHFVMMCFSLYFDDKTGKVGGFI